MSSSAITTQIAQLKVGSVQNQADSTSIYSAGQWSFKNSTALTSVTITDAGNVGVGTVSPPTLKFEISNGTNTGYMHPGVGIGLSVGTKNASPMTFDTNNTERMRIDSSGNVGIGTTPSVFGSYYPTIQANPPASFVLAAKANDIEVGSNYVKDNTFTSRYVTSGQGAALFTVSGPQSNGAFTWFTAASGTAGNTITWSERMRIDANGNLLVGKASASVAGPGILIDGVGSLGAMTATVSDSGPLNTYHVYNSTASAYRFFVSRTGQISATSTSIAGISDISLKENVRDLETGLSQVLALKPRRFDWKAETHLGQKDVAGFIAQEVEEVLPELVYEYKYNETETKKSLKMGDMLPTLVKAIQEQQAQIEALKAEVAALKAP